MKYTTFFFDLGNVLLFFDHMIICDKIEKIYGVNKNFVYTKIFQSGIESRFDRGEISPLEFTRECSNVLGITMDVKVFKEIWEDIFSANLPMIELIKNIKEHFRIFLLSNTNMWHMNHVKAKFDFLNLFDGLILSYIIGLTKPNRNFFEKALYLSGQSDSPNECIFIDDIKKNISAASELGIKGILFKNYNQLYRELNSINLGLALDFR